MPYHRTFVHLLSLTCVDFLLTSIAPVANEFDSAIYTTSKDRQLVKSTESRASTLERTGVQSNSLPDQVALSKFLVWLEH